MIPSFTPHNWYWIVADSLTDVFSSAVGDYVPVADSTYQAWLANGNNPTRAASEAGLGEVLATHGISPIPAAMLAAYKTVVGERLPVRVIFKLLFDLENRVRTLAGQPTITANQYRNAIKNLVD